MARSLFVVILDDPEPKALDRVEETYGENFLRLNDGACFIRAEGMSSDVAKALKLTGKDREFDGIVFALGDSYSGYTFMTTHRWLAEFTSKE